MKKLITITLLSLFIFTTYAQTPYWQWIKSGGSAGSSSNAFESCRDICTDANGNIYGISSIFNFGQVVDTVQKPQGFGYEDFCVFSYRCDGSFRWVRFFGCAYQDFPAGIRVDDAGNVFVAGHVSVSKYSDAHFGDSIIPQTTLLEKSAFLAKLDSTGHTEWINQPGPNFGNPGVWFLRTEKDNQGNICVLSWFSDTITWNSNFVPRRGHYITKFDKTNGDVISIVELEFKWVNHIGTENLFFSIDTDNSIYIMSGVSDTIVVGNDTIIEIDTIRNSLIAKFDPSGQNVWNTEVKGVYSSTTNYYQLVWGKPLIFHNYLYISGQTQSYPGSNFFGVPIINPIATQPTRKTKVIARFSKYTGDFVSVNNLKHSRTIQQELPLSYYNGILAASAGGVLVILNQDDTIKPFPSTLKNYPFIVEIDTALAHFNWGVATIGNGEPKIESITVDGLGNIYLGGRMNGSIFNSFGIETPPAAGGSWDFMIAKVAVTNDSCGCAYAVPHAQLISFVNNVLTVKGSVTNTADSLVWYWGDGSSTVYLTPNTNITHTYQNPGTYTIYLRAWNICGLMEDSLQNLTSGINTLTNTNFSMTYYPNPFTQTLTIEFNKVMKNGEIYLFDLVGKEVLNKQLTGKTTIINTSALQNGIYIMKVVSKDGDMFAGKVVRND